MTIAANVKNVMDVIVTACGRVNRDPAGVTLIAVSKTQPPAAILEAAAAGLQHFGENRVEESGTKIPTVNAQSSGLLTWHMIGHIQSRKTKEVASVFQVVQSVDSLKLAGKLSALAVEQQQLLRVLLEVNVSGEEAKYGLQAFGWQTDSEIRRCLWDEVEQILALPGLAVQGLMTMAPIVEDREHTRPVFAALAVLRNALAESFGKPLPELSMGMTDDYPVAIEEGATMVRIGRAIFGERKR